MSLANEVAPQLEQLVNNLGPERQLAVVRKRSGKPVKLHSAELD